nr:MULTISPECIES: Rv2175c family DNA-binding protein [Frankia]
MVRDRTMLARREGGVLRVPAEFISDGVVVKGLPGLLTLLADAGFTDDEALDWLFREDPSLPGTPMQALVENRGKEVKRRAQALAF